MDAELLSRVQFAFTASFHFIFPPLSMGLGLMLLVVSGVYLRTKDPKWRQLAFFWTKVYGLIFALGVATGVVQEFEFGMNWADYSRFVGNVFGSLLAAEGVFAFFLEGGFLGLMLFGGNRLGPKLWFFATFMVVFGAHFSALWIIMANSWMQTPQGYEVVNDPAPARAVMTDFWEVVWTPVVPAPAPPRVRGVVDRGLRADAERQRVVPAQEAARRAGAVQLLAWRCRSSSCSRSRTSCCLRRQAGHRGHQRAAASSSLRWRACGRARPARRCTSRLGRRGDADDERRLASRACSASWRTSTHRPRSPGIELVRPGQPSPPINLLFQVYHLMFGLGTLFAGRSGCWAASATS